MREVLAYFTDREAQIDAYDQLWKSNTPWILAFDGLSGNGKSTLLDWLIANRCQPAGTPHALLDLYSSPMRQYAPLLRAMAMALCPYLEPAAYARYCTRRQTILEALNRRRIEIQAIQTVTASEGSDLAGVHQQMDLSKLIRDAERHARDELTDAVLDLLGTLPGQVVLFLDTYEALQRGGDADMEGWLWDELIGPARVHCPGLRMIVAGRDRLRMHSVARACAPMKLVSFSTDECRAFLRKREIKDVSLQSAIYHLTGGHPLLTDMAAELWNLGRESGRPLTLAELDTAPQVDGRVESRPEEWLYGRILDHLPPPIKSAARYGVLLRRFDRGTLNEILPSGTRPLDEETFRQFTRYSFIERRSQGDYQAHDLVRRAQLAWLQKADPAALAQFCTRAEAYYRTRYEKTCDPDHLAEALYFMCWHNEKDGCVEWEKTVQTHTLIADRERWRGVVRILEGDEWTEKPLGDMTTAIYAYRRGRWHYYNAEWDAALASYTQALDLFRQVGDRLGEANTRQAIGDVQAFLKDNDAALASYTQALDLFRQVGDRLGEANTRQAIGDVQAFLKDNDAALASYTQALDLFRQIGSRLGEANTLLAVADVVRSQQEWAESKALYDQAMHLYRAIDDRYSLARVAYRLGDWHAAQEQRSEAAGYYRQSIEIWTSIGLHDLVEQILVPRLKAAIDQAESG